MPGLNISVGLGRLGKREKRKGQKEKVSVSVRASAETIRSPAIHRGGGLTREYYSEDSRSPAGC